MSNSISSTEHINIQKLEEGNKYALKSTVFEDIWVRVSGPGDNKAVNTQVYIGEWEEFYIDDLGGGRLVFRSAKWNNYLRANGLGDVKTQIEVDYNIIFVIDAVRSNSKKR